MNPLTSLMITLGFEVALVVGIGFVTERLLASVHDRRRVWCAVLCVVALLTAVELTGLRVEIRRWTILGSLVTPRHSDSRWSVNEINAAAHPVDREPSTSSVDGVGPADLPVASHWQTLLAFWLLGTVVIGVRAGYQRWQLQLLVYHSNRLEVSVAGEIAGRLGLAPERIRLCEAAGFSGPVAFGVVRPTVLLPRGFTHRYSDLELKVLLAHELAHLAACDPLWLAISDVLSGLLWWHPAVWWARRRLRATSEAAADDASCLIPGGRLALAEALVAFGNQLAGETSPAGFGVGGLKSDLATRVTRLLAAPVHASSRLMKRVTLAGTVCSLLAIGIAPWPGEGAQPVVTAALESIGSLASKPPQTLKVTSDDKSESSRSDSLVPEFETGPSESHRQPQPPQESLQLGKTNLAVGGNPDSAKEGSTSRTGLEDVVIPTFQINEGLLQDSVQRLQQILRNADPHKRDLRIMVANNEIRVRQQILQTGPVPADLALQEVVNSCTTPVECTLLGNWIVFDKIPSGEWPLIPRRYQVGPAKLLAHIRGRLEKAGFVLNESNIQNEVRTFLAENGVIIPKAYYTSVSPDPVPSMGAKAVFLTKNGDTLWVLASVPDHNQIHRALAFLQYPSGTMPMNPAPVPAKGVGTGTKPK